MVASSKSKSKKSKAEASASASDAGEGGVEKDAESEVPKVHDTETSGSDEEAAAAMQRAMLKAEDLQIFTRTRKKQGARNAKEQETYQTQEHEVADDPNTSKE